MDFTEVIAQSGSRGSASKDAFTEALFTVPKIDIEEIERAAYDRGFSDGYKSAQEGIDDFGNERYWMGYETGYFEGLQSYD